MCHLFSNRSERLLRLGYLATDDPSFRTEMLKPHSRIPNPFKRQLRLAPVSCGSWETAAAPAHSINQDSAREANVLLL